MEQWYLLKRWTWSVLAFVADLPLDRWHLESVDILLFVLHRNIVYISLSNDAWIDHYIIILYTLLMYQIDLLICQWTWRLNQRIGISLRYKFQSIFSWLIVCDLIMIRYHYVNVFRSYHFMWCWQGGVCYALATIVEVSYCLRWFHSNALVISWLWLIILPGSYMQHAHEKGWVLWNAQCIWVAFCFVIIFSFENGWTWFT